MALSTEPSHPTDADVQLREEWFIAKKHPAKEITNSLALNRGASAVCGASIKENEVPALQAMLLAGI